MKQQTDGMLQAIKNIGKADKWRMNIVGIPTYVAGALISGSYSKSSVVGSFLILICFIMIYSYVYEFIFPKFVTSKSFVKLILFFIAQVLFWVIVLVLQSALK